MGVNKQWIVADTSVLLKWALVESEDKKQAFDLKEKFLEGNVAILVPSHFFVELGNVLSRKALKRAVEVFSAYKMMGLVKSTLSIELAALAFELTERYKKISFYDAIYHALALKTGSMFVTADEKYFKYAKNEGNIVLLRDWS